MPETKGKENFIDTYSISKKALFEAKILRDFTDSQFLVIALNWPRAWGGGGVPGEMLGKNYPLRFADGDKESQSAA